MTNKQSRRSVLASISAGAALPLAATVPSLVSADPVVALARAWAKAMFDPLPNTSDEAADVFLNQVLRPLEECLVATAPVSRDGAVAMLQAVERRLRENAGYQPCWYDEFDMALIGNVRRALAEGRFA